MSDRRPKREPAIIKRGVRQHSQFYKIRCEYCFLNPSTTCSEVGGLPLLLTNNNASVTIASLTLDAKDVEYQAGDEIDAEG